MQSSIPQRSSAARPTHMIRNASRWASHAAKFGREAPHQLRSRNHASLVRLENCSPAIQTLRYSSATCSASDGSDAGAGAPRAMNPPPLLSVASLKSPCWNLDQMSWQFHPGDRPLPRSGHRNPVEQRQIG
eukprot:9501375-Pyramimonas_sp.AAC.3